MPAKGKRSLLAEILAQLVVLLIVLENINVVLCVNFLYLPESMKTEGKITLEHLSETGDITKHHLVFTELIDGRLQRSKLSIGYVSYEPVEYHNRQGRTLELNENKQCSLLEKKFEFIRELAWFLRYTFTDEEMTTFLKKFPHLIGPSGVLTMMNSLNQSPKVGN